MTLWSFEPHHLAVLVLAGLAVVVVWATIGGGVRIYVGPRLRDLTPGLDDETRPLAALPVMPGARGSHTLRAFPPGEEGRPGGAARG